MQSNRTKAFKKLIDKINAGELFINDLSMIFKRFKNGTTRRVEITRNGYCFVNTYVNNKVISVPSHRLIYAYHHGIEALKPNLDVHHKDYNRSNNKIENLEAVTKKRNVRDEHVNKNKTNVKIGYFIMIRDIDRDVIIKELGITQNTLSNWCVGKTYPTIDKAFILADLLEVKIEDLYERKKAPLD